MRGLRGRWSRSGGRYGWRSEGSRWESLRCRAGRRKIGESIARHNGSSRSDSEKQWEESHVCACVLQLWCLHYDTGEFQ